MPKKIAIAAIVTSLLGLSAETIFSRIWNMPHYYWYLRWAFSSLNLGYIENTGSIADFDNRNYFNIFFYALLLTGGILNLFAKRETRLIRYIFSMVLFSKFIIVASTIISVCFNFGRQFESYQWAFTLGYLIIDFLWIWLAWSVLNYLGKGREVATTQVEYNDVQTDIIVESSRWQRLFHLIIDSITYAVLLIPIYKWLITLESFREFFRPLADSVAPQIMLYLIGLIPLTIYFVFFERVFQATPAKLLSETRVVTDTGDRPTTSKIFVRTIVRFVPFESLSVLFARGWHDDWSDTYVVREKREGVNGGWYFFIFPAFFLLGVTGYLSYKSYERHKVEERETAAFEKDRDRLKASLKKLTTNHVISVNNSSGAVTFMKVEKIDGDAITFRLVEGEVYNTSGEPQMSIEPLFNELEETRTLTLTRKELEGAISTEYQPDEVDDPVFLAKVDLLKDGNLCYISHIQEWYGPNIRLGMIYLPSSDGSKLSFELSNSGWEANLLKIDTKGKKVKWDTPLPVTIAATEGYLQGVRIEGIAEDFDEIDYDLTFRDFQGKERVYNLKGEGSEIGDATLIRIK